MTGHRRWTRLYVRAMVAGRRDAKAFAVWQTGAVAAALTAASGADKTGLLLAASIMLLVLGFMLSIRPWPGEQHPAIELLTEDMRVLLARSYRSQVIFCAAMVSVALCQAVLDPAHLWLAVATGGLFLASGFYGWGCLVFLHHDVRRLAVWSLCAQANALFAAAVLFGGWAGAGVLGALLLGQALRRTLVTGPALETPIRVATQAVRDPSSRASRR
jgi:hypothetical protein